MKILHVINNLGSGGAEKLIVQICNSLAQEHEVGLFLMNNHSDFFLPQLDKKVKLYKANGGSRFSLKTFQELRKTAKNYEVIHGHLFPVLYYVSFLISLLPKKKWVFTEHNITNNRRSKKYLQRFEKWIYSRFDRVTAISSGVQSELENWLNHEKEIDLLYNFINIEEINNASTAQRSEFGFTNEDVLFIMVGSFANSQKRQQDLIDSMSYLPEQFKLLLIGEGPRLEEFRSKAEFLGLKDRVCFLGRRSDVYSILKFCDYGVLASEWEGFGLVALEYMACGIPSIASNVNGLNEVVTDKRCLFEKGNSKELAERILFLEDYEAAKSEVLKKQFETVAGYDQPEYMKKLINIYTEE